MYHLTDEIDQLSQQMSAHHTKAIDLSKQLSKSRLSNLFKLENEITELTSLLGMPHSKFSIGHQLKDSLTSQGTDEFFFLFCQ